MIRTRRSAEQSDVSEKPQLYMNNSVPVEKTHRKKRSVHSQYESYYEVEPTAVPDTTAVQYTNMFDIIDNRIEGLEEALLQMKKTIKRMNRKVLL